ncbi:ATP-binding cassette domain-containing protein [Dictyobacter aurantiacus]|uniref:HlyB/MsbA family ABC transporter n=1 Tax=Dictyobacter aurantiacus TaxID=1936993 RepID=A0A401ZAV3_9CHLR|nr:ABC transporter ATP-binding protein [Dictyobacter aurantiacus]GCE03997.1 HlyB/MsbA family ABC transporter [Dictyobacter aurantiacus]
MMLPLGKLVRYRPLLFGAMVLAWALASCLPLLTGLLTGAIFDGLSGHRTVLGLNLWLLGALLLVCEIVTQVTVSGWFLLHRYCIETLNDLVRRNFFYAILCDKRGVVGTPQAGEFISRFVDDVMLATDDVINEWYRLSGEVLFSLIALIIMVRINALLTLATVVPLALIVTVVHQARAHLEAYRQAARQSEGRALDFLGEIFGAVQAIKVSSAEDRVLVRLESLNERRRVSSLKDTILGNVLNSVGGNMTDLGRGLIVLLAAQALRAHTFSVGDFALFVLYLQWLLMMPRRVGRLLTALKLAPVSTRRVTELLPDISSEELVAHHPLHTYGELPAVPYIEKSAEDHLLLLEVSGLSYRHGSSGRGIEDVNLRIATGSFTVITGRIGAGKTTLLQTLLGLLPHNAGMIFWNGVAVDEPGEFFVAPRCAYTPQVPMLFSASLQENILLGLPEEKVDVARAITDAVLERDVALLENGLATQVGTRGVRLSGGQIQRAAAARMFVREPELLVFDDLSSALDVETERTLWQRLAIRPHLTCLVVSHRQAALQRADQIIVMKNGRIDAVGKLEELADNEYIASLRDAKREE